MNLQLNDIFTGQQPSRQWTPLMSQQLRLRHLYRITAYNLVTENEGDFYYTLHQTSMSAPFYTSEKVPTCNPRWADIRLSTVANSSAKACVVRVWQAASNGDADRIVFAWGVNFSGLVYLGNKRADVQPASFRENSLILHLHGGFFTSPARLRNDPDTFVPFIDHLNVAGGEAGTKVYRTVALRIAARDVKRSYDVGKLRRLQALQLAVKNKSSNLEHLRARIGRACGRDEDGSADSDGPEVGPESNVRYAPQPLTMNFLNKMLQEKPTKLQKKEIIRITKEIENSRLKIKLLSQQKDKQVARLRQLKEKHVRVYEENQETESTLMESYRQLSKEVEKLRNSKRDQIHHREILLEDNSLLYNRRKQLLNQLLDLYPIECTGDQKYNINNVYLPNSDLLNDCSQDSVAVALGFVAHVLVMCSNFLQVPLRYPIIHMGSRSIIIDHISPCIADYRQQYPLYLRGKDRYQFNYAVCLLNKNIAQLRWICGLHTQNLKASLPNLLTFLLQASDSRSKPDAVRPDAPGPENGSRPPHERDAADGPTRAGSACGLANGVVPVNYVSARDVSDPILDSLRRECSEERKRRRASSPTAAAFKRVERSAPLTVSEEAGSSRALAIPEAFLTQQISPNSFKNYMTSCNKLDGSQSDLSSRHDMKTVDSSGILSCDIVDGITSLGSPIEQGVDATDPSVCQQLNPILPTIPKQKNSYYLARKRLSRSVGSYDDDKAELSCSTTGSDSLLVSTTNVFLPSVEKNDIQESRVREWLSKTPLESKCQSELGNNAGNNYGLLSERTEALLNTTSFHLVKPK